jgi:hypothetical protein
MFRALLCPSSAARQTAVVASGFRVNVKVDVFYLSGQRCTEPQTLIGVTIQHDCYECEEPDCGMYVEYRVAATYCDIF